jgi:D-alanine-D-alanine ligase
MRVGIAYDLREEYLRQGYTEEETAEFDGLETIQALDQALQSLGYETDRIGSVGSLVARLAAKERWGLVFNIAEGVNGLGREAQVPALLDAFRVPYVFSDPVVMALTLHKGLAKHIVRDQGIRTADFAVVHDASDVADIALPLPLFVKPIGGGTSVGISPASKICSRGDLASACRTLLQTYRQPVLVESFLGGREFTVGVVGTGPKAQALGVLEVVLREQAEADVYSYVNKSEYQARVSYQLAEGAAAASAEAMALRVWRGLGCRDAGRVDLRCDLEGNLHFLEVNPLAGLHPQHSDLVILCRLRGIRYPQLIRMIMDSALERLLRDRDV